MNPCLVCVGTAQDYYQRLLLGEPSMPQERMGLSAWDTQSPTLHIKHLIIRTLRKESLFLVQSHAPRPPLDSLVLWGSEGCSRRSSLGTQVSVPE